MSERETTVLQGGEEAGDNRGTAALIKRLQEEDAQLEQ